MSAVTQTILYFSELSYRWLLALVIMALRCACFFFALLQTVAVLGWGQGAQAPQILPSLPPQIFDWFRSALFILEGF